jgi:hypothetical protein
MSWTLTIQIIVYMGVLAFIASAWGYNKGYKEGRAFQRKITHKYRESAVNHGTK